LFFNQFSLNIGNREGKAVFPSGILCYSVVLRETSVYLRVKQIIAQSGTEVPRSDTEKNLFVPFKFHLMNPGILIVFPLSHLDEELILPFYRFTNLPFEAECKRNFSNQH
jgi:hypothetical protein